MSKLDDMVYALRINRPDGIEDADMGRHVNNLQIRCGQHHGVIRSSGQIRQNFRMARIFVTPLCRASLFSGAVHMAWILWSFANSMAVSKI